MRKCKGEYWIRGKGAVQFDDGLFHQWGAAYEEFEAGPGNYTVAIVELPDGKIVEVLPSGLVFTEVPK